MIKENKFAIIMKIQTSKVFGIVSQAKEKGFTTVSCQGSSRSGKTRNIIIWLILQCIQRSNIIVSIVRATSPALKGSVLRDFIEVMNQLNIYDEKSFNKSELIYKFKNGTFIEFFSCDSEQKMRGRKRNILFANEANELTFEEWKQLQLRTTEFTIIDYNPSFTEAHWICSVNQEKETFHFITTYKDNPFLEEKVIKEIEKLKDTNKSLWTIYGLGLHAQIEGLIFDSVEVINEFPNNCKKEFLGIDFGYSNDPTAIIKVGIIDNNLYIEEIAYQTHLLTSDIISILKSSCYNEIIKKNNYNQISTSFDYKKYKIISESADARLIEEIYRAGLNIHPVKKYAGSIDAGIMKMKEFNIHITKNSTNVIREFKNYTYSQDKEGKWLNSPIDLFNHSIDAIRYVILNEVLGGERQKIDKNKLKNLVF